MITKVSVCGDCAEIVLAVCMERGLRARLHKPDLSQPTALEIEAPDKATYYAAQNEWMSRMTGDKTLTADAFRIQATRRQ